MNIDLLSWDSDFFNKKIGKVSCENHSCENDLIDILKLAKSEGYELLYVFAPSDLFFTNELLEKYSGRLVDRKVVFSQSIDINILDCGIKDKTSVIEYKNNQLTEDLESLSYLSGQYSRFRLDNKFDPGDYSRLYKTWMINSLNKKIADKVFIVEENGKILGMMTLKYKDFTGEIGLIAVSDLAQGKGYGKELVNAGICDLSDRGIKNIEVSTQLNNEQACKFYQKCGFEIKLIVNIYHFWL